MIGDNESDLGQAVYSLILNVLAREVHTAMPGRVEAVGISDGVRVVDVKPLLKRADIRGEQREFSVAPGVLFLTVGTSKSSVFMPVQKGDLVLLIYSERSVEKWKQNTTIADTVFGRQFDLSDAFAIPFNFGGLSTGYNNEDVIIEHNSQTITIKNNGDIEIGSSDLKKLLTEAAADVFNNHVHNVSTSGTAAAQMGTTSSPAAITGTGPVVVSPSPGGVLLFKHEMSSNEMTSKVTSE